MPKKREVITTLLVSVAGALILIAALIAWEFSYKTTVEQTNTNLYPVHLYKSDGWVMIDQCNSKPGLPVTASSDGKFVLSVGDDAIRSERGEEVARQVQKKTDLVYLKVSDEYGGQSLWV